MIISKGTPQLMGSQKLNRNYNFSFVSKKDKLDLLLFDSKAEEIKYRVTMDDSFKTGDVFSCKLSDVSLDKCLYCYEVGGKRLIDPYAKTVYDCEEFGIEKDAAKYVSRVELDHFDWEGDQPLHLPYDQSILYKFHVRGFTKSRTSGVRHKGTFAGVIEKIPYLKQLGITTVDLMPCYEYDEMGKFPKEQEDTLLSRYTLDTSKGKVNYWGYVNGFHFAPKASFSSIAAAKSDYTVEMKRMVKQLHKNQIEVIMEMYFTDETPNMILDCLRYWVREYHVDGFHLYAENASLQIVAADPLLANTKIITVYWDGAKGHYKNVANCNDGFEKTARRFLKGDDNQLETFVKALKNNPENSANINYITNHNGFTMMDLVSYDRKHNDANGENNRDGEDFNYSWNCGVEGKSRKKKIVDLRQKQIKNAFLLLLLSQGTPLILAGDEFENSQCGNNNPYCIDSETTWLNWKNADNPLEITTFLKELIAFRKSRPILHMPKKLLEYDQLGCGYPDISFHGSNAWYNAMENYNRHIGIMYCSRYAQRKQKDHEDNLTCDVNTQQNMQNELIYVAYNMHWENHELALPNIATGCEWQVLFGSGAAKIDAKVKDNRLVKLEPRSIAILIGQVKEPHHTEVSAKSSTDNNKKVRN